MRRLAVVPIVVWVAAVQAVWPAALSWTDLSGHPFALERLRGRVVVLNFWATWCVPCQKEMPDLNRLQRRYGVRGVQVLGAAADDPDQRLAVAEFARRLKIEFPVVLGADTAQMKSLGLGATLPATVVLDRDGRAVERFDGIFEEESLRKAVERALDGEDEAPGHAHAAAQGPEKTQASLVPS